MFAYSINKYNEAFSKSFKSLGIKTKPEPWLHVAILNFTNMKDDKEHGIKASSGAMYWVVYVWDTRQVLEFGKAKQNATTMKRLTTSSTMASRGGLVRAPKAKDNHKPLNGDNQIINAINKYVLAGNDKYNKDYSI